MSIRAVILDVSNTLITDKTGVVVPGVPEMLERLTVNGLDIILASNRAGEVRRGGQMLGIGSDRLLHPAKVGARSKGSGKFIEAACAQLQIGQNELLYLGDGEFDFYEAINRNVAFFRAEWAESAVQYGIPVSTPQRFIDIIECFFLKDLLWYCRVDDTDSQGRQVIMRGLLNPDLAKNTGITALLKSRVSGRPINGFPLDEYLSLHLLASTYLEGLHLTTGKERSLWCLYPSHNGQQTGALHSFATMASKLLHNQFQPDLLVRHTEAESSKERRMKGLSVSIDEQLRTIQVDPGFANKLTNRDILVVDDFTTKGYGFETARNLLLNAEAARVVCVAVGKYTNNADMYPPSYQVFVPKSGTVWSSFAPNTLASRNFRSERVPAHYNAYALEYFDSGQPGAQRQVSTPPSSSSALASNMPNVAPVSSRQRSASIKPAVIPGDGLLDAVRNNWELIIQQVQARSSFTAALLKQAYPDDVIEAAPGMVPKLILSVTMRFYEYKLREPQRQELIQQVLEEVLGISFYVDAIQHSQ